MRSTRGSSGALSTSVTSTKPAVHSTISAVMRCAQHTTKSVTSTCGMPECNELG